MGLSIEELKAQGVAEGKGTVPVPDEWTVKEYREVQSKKDGKQYLLVDFINPQEQILTLFGHSMFVVDGKMHVRPNHLKRQLRQIQ